VEKADWEIKLQFLEEIQDLIVPHYAQEWRKNANSRSNSMIIERIYIKIKSNDIIKFLIGQFDLIMGQIEF
jgi:hypothetical protein